MQAITVYALQFSGGGIYVGITKDLERRIGEHIRRQSPSTQRMKGPFEVIYQKQFSDYTTARQHEKFLKSGTGRKLLLEEKVNQP